MQRLSWLFEDAVTRAPLPFDPLSTRLELLGFLLSAEGVPGPVEIFAQQGGRHYVLAHDGLARRLEYRVREGVWKPDIPAPGGQVQVGFCAFALENGQVLVGPSWRVRRQLRNLLRPTSRGGESVSPELAEQANRYLARQAELALLRRRYASLENSRAPVR